MFEIVDGRTTTDDDGRTPEHGYTISSPCEPNGSGELGSGELIIASAERHQRKIFQSARKTKKERVKFTNFSSTNHNGDRY